MGSIIRGSDNFDSQKIVLGSAKAWINYNAQTPVILDSFNISSITDNGVGDFTINFTIPMLNSGYSVLGTTINGATVARSGNHLDIKNGTSLTTTAFTVQARAGASSVSDGVAQDLVYNCLTVFGN